MTGVRDVAVSLETRQVVVEHAPEWAGVGGVAAAIRDAGYRAWRTSGAYTGSHGAP